MSEPGGRAVNRSRTQYGWPAGSQWPALKADFVAERVEGGKPLPFQILNLDAQGQPVDGQVVSYGKVLKKDEVIVILKKVRA